MALDGLIHHLETNGGGFIIDADISKFFDMVPHDALMSFIRLKVKDPIILHSIWEFLSAGTLVSGEHRGELLLVKSTKGTPQGGVISPLLANIYLHHGLDEFIVTEISPSIIGGVQFYRYADDVVCVMREREQAVRVLDMVARRLGEYGLQLNMTKTKILDCRRPDLIEGDIARDGRSCIYLGHEVKWERSHEGTWKIVSRPAVGRTQLALQKAKANIREKVVSGCTAGQIRSSIISAITGFQSYFRSEGCRDDGQYYSSELGKLLDYIRCAKDTDLVDEDLFDFVDWS